MTTRTAHTTPFIFLPFVWLWQLVGFILGLTGRLLVVILGFGFLVIGFLLTLTVIGAIVGIPLMILAIAMIVRGLF